MRWRAYPAYKRSGIEWLREIPAHWSVERLKYISSASFSSVDKHSLEGEYPVQLCNYTDVYYNDYITADLEFMKATATSGEIAKFSLAKGDVIVTKDSETWDDIAVAAYVPSELENVLCGYHLALIRPSRESMDGKYLFLSFCARGINDQFQVAAHGITRYGLGKLWLDNSLFPVPPLHEQRAIAAFLDRETGRIDALIAKKERQIELLQEKRAALISHTVTRGLDPAAPMKDSGIKRLGKIPSHWEIKRLRFVCRVNPTKSEVAHLPPNTDISFLPMEAIGENGSLSLDESRTLDEVWQGYTYFRDDDVIVAKITPCFENGKGAIVRGLLNGIGFGTTELHVLRAQPGVSPDYASWMTCSYPFRKLGEASMYGAAGQKRVPEEYIKNFALGLPLLEEQRAIADFLDRETGRIDALIAKVQESIEKLQEYRTALISAAVTGQIDVREVV